MTFEEIIKDLKKKIYKPVYVLMGDEAYYIDEISNYIINNTLTEEEKSFNQSILYGKDVTVNQIDHVARRYPMMANQQVVVVKEAQNLKNIEDLVHYCSKPLASTILVICHKYKTIDKRKRLLKEVEKNGIVFESKKLYENQVPKWIHNYIASKNYTITPEAEMLLAEYLGNDLSKIVNEIDKLIISIPAGTTIDGALIENNIGISKEYNIFELQKALSQKDILKVNRIIKYFGENQKENPFVVTISSLFSYFNKLLIYHFIQDKSNRNSVASQMGVAPYFLQDYETAARKYSAKKVVDTFAVLREYDLKSKGIDNVSADVSDLLKEMMFKILH